MFSVVSVDLVESPFMAPIVYNTIGKRSLCVALRSRTAILLLEWFAQYSDAQSSFRVRQ